MSDEVILERIDTPEDYPPSEACLRYMDENGFDPEMEVWRAVTDTEFMLRTMAHRPDAANIVQLLLGPFGIVAPAGMTPIRVVEFQVGEIVLNVESEYDYEDNS